MTTTLSPSPKLQFFDSEGALLAGGKLYTYAAGTSTPLATYTDSTGASANTNPVVLDARGEANVWLGASSYKFVLKTSEDSLIWTVDNISNTSALTSLAASNGSSLVGFIQSGSGAVATTVQAKLRETISVKDFGATGDGTTDDTTAVNNALVAAAGKSLYFPSGTYLCTTLTVYGGTTVYGDSPTTSIIKAKSSLSSSAALITNPNRSGTAYTYTDRGIELRNIGLNGNNLGSRTEGLLFFSKVEDALIDNCRVANVQYIGAAFAGCLSVTVSNSLFTECGNSTVTTEGGAAVWIGAASDTTESFDVSITDNSFLSNRWSAVYANGSRLSVIANYMSANQESAVFMTGNNNIISDNWISNQTKKYISASGIEAGGDNLTVTGNYIGDTDSDSISVTDLQFATITGNTLLNPGRDATTFPTAACVGIITTVASPNQPRNITIVGNNMWAPLNDAYAGVVMGGAGAAPAYLLISDNQMNGNTWTSGYAIYTAPGLSSSTQTIRDNPGVFDIFDYGGYAAGRFYAGETMSPAAASTLALSANTMYVMPFAVRQLQTWTKIGCNVTTSAVGALAYLGIYRMENGIPTKLVLDAGAVGLASTGTKEITISQPLPSGMYALVVLSNNSSVVLKAGTPSAAAIAAIGTSAVGTADTLITASRAYGTLPTTFPTVAYTTGDCPLLTLRHGV